MNYHISNEHSIEKYIEKRNREWKNGIMLNRLSGHCLVNGIMFNRLNSV